jgi:hypothetical protein
VTLSGLRGFLHRENVRCPSRHDFPAVLLGWGNGSDNFFYCLWDIARGWEDDKVLGDEVPDESHEEPFPIIWSPEDPRGSSLTAVIQGDGPKETNDS